MLCDALFQGLPDSRAPADKEAQLLLSQSLSLPLGQSRPESLSQPLSLWPLVCVLFMSRRHRRVAEWTLRGVSWERVMHSGQRSRHGSKEFVRGRVCHCFFLSLSSRPPRGHIAGHWLSPILAREASVRPPPSLSLSRFVLPLKSLSKSSLSISFVVSLCLLVVCLSGESQKRGKRKRTSKSKRRAKEAEAEKKETKPKQYI